MPVACVDFTIWEKMSNYTVAVRKLCLSPCSKSMLGPDKTLFLFPQTSRIVKKVGSLPASLDQSSRVWWLPAANWWCARYFANYTTNLVYRDHGCKSNPSILINVWIALWATVQVLPHWIHLEVCATVQFHTGSNSGATSQPQLIKARFCAKHCLYPIFGSNGGNKGRVGRRLKNIRKATMTFGGPTTLQIRLSFL